MNKYVFRILFLIGLVYSAQGFSQNIAPLATVTASNCSTGPCSAFNNLNFGTCGVQEVWISTSGPPSATPGVNWVEWTWTSTQNISEMVIHHAQTTARFLTGALIQTWNGSAWVNHHTFSNLPMQCINTVTFPLATTTRMRITSFQMTGTGQNSNPNFREIEIFGPSICSGTPDGGIANASSTVIDCRDSVLLYLDGHSVLQGINYQWQYNAGGAGWVNFGGNQDSIWSPSVSVPTVFRCNVTCTAPGGGTTSSSGVVVSTLPIEVSLGNDTFICQGASVTLSSDVLNGTYLWDNNTTAATRTVSNPGTYHITITDEFGCKGSDTVEVTGVGQPSAGMRSIHLIDRRWLFEATSVSAATEEVEWDFGDGSPLATGFSVNHTYQSNGTFLVTMTAKNRCDDTDISKKAVVVSGFGESIDIADLSKKMNINLYPNPASTRLVIENPDKHKVSQMVVVDNLGRVLTTEDIHQKVEAIQLDVSAYAPGKYIVQLKLENSVVSLPFTKL